MAPHAWGTTRIVILEQGGQNTSRQHSVLPGFAGGGGEKTDPGSAARSHFINPVLTSKFYEQISAADY